MKISFIFYAMIRILKETLTPNDGIDEQNQ
jgi:hypothetical protein